MQEKSTRAAARPLFFSPNVYVNSQVERNYHIFYELQMGMTNAERDQYSLDSAHNYKRAPRRDAKSVDDPRGIERNDLANYHVLMTGLATIGLKRPALLAQIATQMHLGEVSVEVIEQENDKTTLTNLHNFRAAAECLGVDSQLLERHLLQKVVETTRDTTTTDRGVEQSRELLLSLGKFLYRKLFEHVVYLVNSVLCNPQVAQARERQRQREMDVERVLGVFLQVKVIFSLQ